MKGIVFFIVWFAVIGLMVTAALLLAQNSGVRKFLEKHSWVKKALVFGYVVFCGCFVFPIRSEPFPLDFQKAYLLIASYGIIGLASAEIFGPGREKLVYITTLFLTAVGMGCRYLLEFGETSNTYNFTIFNIVSYLALIPAGTAMGYHWIVKWLKKRK